MKKIFIALVIACCCFGCSKKETEAKIMSCSISENQSVMTKSVLIDVQYTSSPEVLIRTEKLRLTTSILQDSYQKAYELMKKKLDSIPGVEFTFTFEGSTVENVTKIDLTKFDVSKINELEFLDEAVLDNNKLTVGNLRNYFILEEYSCSDYEE